MVHGTYCHCDVYDLLWFMYVWLVYVNRSNRANAVWTVCFDVIFQLCSSKVGTLGFVFVKKHWRASPAFKVFSKKMVYLKTMITVTQSGIILAYFPPAFLFLFNEYLPIMFNYLNNVKQCEPSLRLHFIYNCITRYLSFTWESIVYSYHIFCLL